MVEELTTIQLTPIEAQSFIAFQKHRALIGLLESIGAFNILGGNVTIHFNRLGEIQSVKKEEYFTP